MKVAVCYSGFLRNLTNSFENIQRNLLNGCDVDYYIHTWKSDEYKNEIKYAEKNLSPQRMVVEEPKIFELHPYLFINSETKPEDYKEEIKKTDEKDKFYFPPPSEQNEYTFYSDLEVARLKYYSSFPYSILSQFYSIRQSNFLRKIDNKEYDLVVRIRSDLFFDGNISLFSFNKNELNVINSPCHRGTNLTVKDHFAASNSSNMDLYSDLSLYIPAYYFVYKVDFISELLLGHHLNVHGIEVRKHNITSHIDRGTLLKTSGIKL